MKKVLLAAALLVGFAASAEAASIIGSKHDLNSVVAGNSINISGTNQTCVFCHAPHNALVNKLLWNRKNVLDGASFKIYTSYNSTAMRDALISRTTLSSSSNSLLCLSCHSLTSSSQLVSNTNKTGLTDNSTVAGNTRFNGTTGGMTDLSNDHPVGINYVTAQGTTVGLVGLRAPAGTTHVQNVAVRLFNSATTGAGTMECASCHLVHDNANGKFLALSNTGSALCLNCHIK